jgi:membrane protein
VDKLEAALWSPAVARAPALPRAGIKLLRFVYAVLRDALAGDLPLRAMGLVYVTILSIVPLIAISFSVLKGFGFHKQMEPLLYELLAPLGDRGVELTDQVMGFVDNIQGDVLAYGGLALLFFTTISMAQKVEASLNFVWRVERSRNIAQRLTQYLSIIILGPVVMVTAMSLIAAAEGNAVVRELTDIQAIGESVTLARQLLPYVLVVAGFTFVYSFLPNTKVRLGPAAVGGLTGGVLWATTGVVFAAFVATSTRTLNIYATFAIVIIALIWLYLCWLILLVGAQVAFYAQHPEHMRLGFRPVSLGRRQREEIALSVMGLVAQGFRNGQPHPQLRDVAEELGLPSLALSATVERLEATGLLLRTDKDELLPGRDPGQILLRDVLAAVREPQSTDVFPEGHWSDGVKRIAAGISEAIDSSVADQSIYDLLESAPATDD